MVLKTATRRKFCLVITLLIILTCSWQSPANSEATEAVRLDTLLVGVVHRARRRYQVKDIKVGDVSVRSLFHEIPREDPGWLPGGCLRYRKISLVLKGGSEWQELKQILIAHRDRPVEIVLRDEWNPLGRKDPYEYPISIPVIFETTKCDEVTRVVYERVISKLIKEENEESLRKEGETYRRLDVSEVFDKLRDDNEIETYIDGLGPVTNTPCVETIRLLKSQKEEKTTGFGSGEYVLSKKIQKGLRLIIDAMATKPDWWRRELSLRVTGFTDEVEVKKLADKRLQISETGISTEAWSRIDNKFDVYYSGCENNKVKDQSIYLSFREGRGEQQVESQIENNCELGAVRAYVALVYLISELNRDGSEDSYATGGIFSGKDASKKADDPKKRRVHVDFIMRAVKVEKSNR